jgi:hypothetical protein
MCSTTIRLDCIVGIGAIIGQTYSYAWGSSVTIDASASSTLVHGETAEGHAVEV